METTSDAHAIELGVKFSSDVAGEIRGVKFYKGPKGTLQWGPQYSYIVRNTWSGVGGPSIAGQPNAPENMFLTSFRYYLP